jgi:uncharacterized protein (TIGR03083 family)
MDSSRYLGCLDADVARLRAVAAGSLSATVPSCPGWTVADLVRHVSTVFLHKAAAMREGVQPDPWPPEGLEGEQPLALLDRAYAELTGQFGARKPADPAWTWYEPDQSVGFWIRRMAQETVIHRIDAELAAGQPVAPVPADLAIDGIDELLTMFVAYNVARWAEDYAGILGESPVRTYLLRTDGAAWQARTGPGVAFAVRDGAGDGIADVTVSGPPDAMLRWVWNREDQGGAGRVTVTGPPEAVGELQRCIVAATQ